MASNHTPNYNLNQWQATDKVVRADFNEDNAKIDAALHSLAAGSAALDTQKADKTTVAALTERTAALEGRATALEETKAAQTALDALSQRVTQVKDSALRIATGTYVGNGKTGDAGKRTLNFSSTLGRPPIMLIVSGGGSTAAIFQGQPSGLKACIVTWSGNSVTWGSANSIPHFNDDGYIFYYAAIG